MFHLIRKSIESSLISMTNQYENVIALNQFENETLVNALFEINRLYWLK